MKRRDRTPRARWTPRPPTTRGRPRATARSSEPTRGTLLCDSFDDRADPLLVYVLMVSSGGLTVREHSFAPGGGSIVHTPSGNVVANQWTRVAIGIDFTTSPSTLTVVINGTSALTRQSQIPFLPAFDPVVAAGIWFAEPTPAFDLRVDDVVVTGE